MVPSRPLRLLSYLAAGLSLAATLAWLSSTGREWLIGMQHEPYLTAGIGTGRIKIICGYSHAFREHHPSWTASVYRGLDQRQLNFGLHVRDLGGVLVLCVPLWPAAVLSAIMIPAMVARQRSRSRQAPHQCTRCGYPLRGLAGNVCPECGAQALAGQSEAAAPFFSTRGREP